MPHTDRIAAMPHTGTPPTESTSSMSVASASVDLRDDKAKAPKNVPSKRGGILLLTQAPKPARHQKVLPVLDASNWEGSKSQTITRKAG